MPEVGVDVQVEAPGFGGKKEDEEKDLEWKVRMSLKREHWD